MNNITNEIITILTQKYGQSERIEKGVRQVSALWTDEDGTAEEMKNFCMQFFISDPTKLDELTKRFEKNLDTLGGHIREIYRNFNENVHLEKGEMQPIDLLFAEYNPMGHITDDFFKTKLAFAVLLNYPIYTLSEKNTLGKNWTEKEWAQARLADGYNHRIPAEVSQQLMQVHTRAENYTSQYNICMDKIIVDGKEHIFPDGLKLISHWGLRDYLKNMYKEPDGDFKQKIIYQIFNRIIKQEIPEIVINNNKVSWDPFTNKVYQDGNEIKAEAENNVRYEYILETFKAELLLDKCMPDCPNAIDRNFNLALEIDEEAVTNLFISVLNSETVKQCAKLIEKRLGRQLRATDIWYSGFRDFSPLREEELNKAVASAYETVDDLQKGLPEILMKLGFSEEKSKYLANNIVVENSRSAGHALGAGGKGFKSHLRTRFNNNKSDYISYNTFMHELGHCVESVFSLNGVSSTLISGIPNTAFTEAFAFVFQSRDQEVLGISGKDEVADSNRILHCLWHCYELCGVSLLCINAWKYMYSNKTASPEELKNFIISKAKEIWNTWYAPLLGETDSIILACYTHMINHGLYLPNYAIGEMIRSQIENHLKDKNLAQEMEKLCIQGSLTPYIWLEKGMGSPLSAKFILDSANRAIKLLDNQLATISV